jgi:hypothetical protein
VSDDPATLAYEASLRSLDKQERDLVFSISGSRVFEELYEFRDDIGEVHRRLAYDLDRFREANDGALQRLLWGFRIAAAALGAEVALLLTSLTATLG